MIVRAARFAVVIFFFLLGDRDVAADLWQLNSGFGQPAPSLGIVPQLQFDPTEFTLFADGIFPVSPAMLIQGRIGLGSLDPYLGFFGKMTLVGLGPLGVHAWGGFHYLGGFSLDAAVPIGYGSQVFDLYVGPRARMNLNGDQKGGWALLFGYSVAIQPTLWVHTEFSLRIDNIENAGSAGIRMYF